ncbi:MAG: hypothetical protein NTY48_07430 [Candidatus Diapherotrites archaeon]|nr:hypothetical protein [Candidatus Diapherotrites archaeon]
MRTKKSVLPESSGLGEKEKEIYFLVLDNWPSTPLEIAKQMNEDVSTREKQKRASTKYSYYLKKLIEKRLLLSKKAGNSTIVWPLIVEKYRTIHNILKHHEVEHLAAMNSHKQNQNRNEENYSMTNLEYIPANKAKTIGVR